MPCISALKLLPWACVAVLGAVALAFVTGLVNPHEKVSGSWPVIVVG
jgi:carbon starvation protein